MELCDDCRLLRPLEITRIDGVQLRRRGTSMSTRACSRPRSVRAVRGPCQRPSRFHVSSVAGKEIEVTAARHRL